MLENLDLSLTLDKEQYDAELVRYQVALYQLGYQVYVQKRPVIMVFEGWDAAGKGGAIKRVTEKLDPRGYVVYPIGAPQGDDATHHYLWRFWHRLPELGQIAIFDRSWYGRVLVERIEGFCKETDWKRAYREINEFEHQLIDFGTILLKFWFHISQDEQLLRFEGRAEDKLRSWKLTADDWRNRDKWNSYLQAVEDMVLKTSTISAPWTIVEGNSKNYARIKVLRTIVDQLSTQLQIDPFAQSITKDEKKKDRKKSKKNHK